MSLQIRAQLLDHDSTLALYAFDVDREGNRVNSAQPLVLVACDPEARAEPFAEVSLHSRIDNAAQRLMDDLWRCGLRPKDHATPSQLAAVEEHLKTVQLVAQAASVSSREKDALIAEVVRASIAARAS